MQALSQLSYGPTEGRELWGSGVAKSNPATIVTGLVATAPYTDSQPTSFPEKMPLTP